MPVLSDDDVRAFLEEPGHLLRIATVDDEGVPLVVPIWFVAEEGRIWFTPRLRSAWWGHVQRDPRVCVVVDEEMRPWRKVMLRGPLRVDHAPGDDDAWRERYRRIACRYVPEAEADAYLQRTHDEARALLSIGFGDPGVSCTTWRMPVKGEDATGIWARRYYTAGG